MMSQTDGCSDSSIAFVDLMNMQILEHDDSASYDGCRVVDPPCTLNKHYEVSSIPACILVAFILSKCSVSIKVSCRDSLHVESRRSSRIHNLDTWDDRRLRQDDQE